MNVYTFTWSKMNSFKQFYMKILFNKDSLFDACRNNEEKHFLKV